MGSTAGWWGCFGLGSKEQFSEEFPHFEPIGGILVTKEKKAIKIVINIIQAN
jgi:hypothetical protein